MFGLGMVSYLCDFHRSRSCYGRNHGRSNGLYACVCVYRRYGMVKEGANVAGNGYYLVPRLGTNGLL